MCILNALKTLNNDYGTLIQTLLVIVGFGIAIYQLIDLKKNVRASSMNEMVKNQREISSFKLKYKDLIETEEGKRVYTVMLLNNAVNFYIQHNKGTLEEDWWNSIIYNMKQTFQKDDFRKLWSQVKDYYSPEFQTFMETEILK